MSNGKGDTPRPLSVDQETFSNNWDRVFGTPKEEAPEEYRNLLTSGMFWELFPGLTGNWIEDKHRWSLAILAKESQHMGLYESISSKKDR